METNYFEAYNRPNVRHIDLLETPIDRVTETGIKTTQVHLNLIYSSTRRASVLVSGSEIQRCDETPAINLLTLTSRTTVTGAFDAIDFRGIDNNSLLEEWKDGPRTFLGITVEHFPNMFMSMGPHQAYGNIPRSIESAVGWIAECVEYCRDHNITYIEAQDKGVCSIMQFCNESLLTIFRCESGLTMCTTLGRIFSAIRLTRG
jgi:cation diffusion facilitator CzcD-associated flavoprotein CzcO